MDYDACRAYLLAKPDAFEDYPFGPIAAVFKIRSKMFATLSTGRTSEGQETGRMNLKCDPREAEMLRDIFAAVIPGYHMNKTHWNTVILDGTIPDGEIQRMIDRSYALVIKGMKKTDRQALEIRHGNDAIYR